MIAIIMDYGENRAEKSRFMNQDLSTSLSDYAKSLMRH